MLYIRIHVSQIYEAASFTFKSRGIICEFTIHDMSSYGKQLEEA